MTKWSKLGTSFHGVSVDTLLAQVEPRGAYLMARSYGGYTTNLPLPDLRDGKAWIAYQYDGKPLAAIDRRGGGRGLRLLRHDAGSENRGEAAGGQGGGRILRKVQVRLSTR